jgi:hypothetical protein
MAPPLQYIADTLADCIEFIESEHASMGFPPARID